MHDIYDLFITLRYMLKPLGLWMEKSVYHANLDTT
jgi:hypothetical protein